MKNLLVTGVFGDKVCDGYHNTSKHDCSPSLSMQTTHMMSRFPVNYVRNVGEWTVWMKVNAFDFVWWSPVDMDRRQLNYLAYTVEEELKLEYGYMCKKKWVLCLSNLCQLARTTVLWPNCLILCLFMATWLGAHFQVLRCQSWWDWWSTGERRWSSATCYSSCSW